MKLLLMATMCVLAAPAAFAQSTVTAADPPPPAAKPAGDPDRVICKEDTATGQRIASRTCRTKREWDAMADRARHITEAIQMGEPGHTCSSGPC